MVYNHYGIYFYVISFNKYFLGTYYVKRMRLGVGAMLLTKADGIPAFRWLTH